MRLLFGNISARPLLAFVLVLLVIANCLSFDVGPERVERAACSCAVPDLFTHKASAAKTERFDCACSATASLKGVTDHALIYRRCVLNELLLAIG